MHELEPTAVLYKALPDSIKKAVGEFPPLEKMSVEDMHDMLMKIRQDLTVPPWHRFTLYVKKEASALGAYNTCWTRIGNHADDFFNDDIGVCPSWVVFSFVQFDDEGTTEKKPVGVDLKRDIVWSFSSECKLNGATINQVSTNKIKNLCVSLFWIKRVARYLLERGYHGYYTDILVRYTSKGKSSMMLPDGKEYIITEMPHNSRDRKHEQLASIAYLKTTETACKQEPPVQPVKQPKKIKDLATVETFEQSAKLVSKFSGKLLAEDREVIRTMFDMVKQQLANMNMLDTIGRWQQTVDRLTKGD